MVVKKFVAQFPAKLNDQLQELLMKEVGSVLELREALGELGRDGLLRLATDDGDPKRYAIHGDVEGDGLALEELLRVQPGQTDEQQLVPVVAA
jgi:hypothetical protein